MASSQYNDAFQCIENAKQCEQSGDLCEAKRLYVQGIGHFLEIIKHEKNATKKQIIQQNINTFIHKAEALQAQIQTEPDTIDTQSITRQTEGSLTELKDDDIGSTKSEHDKCVTMQQLIDELRNTIQKQEDQISFLQQENNQIDALNQEIETLKKAQDALYKSLAKALSFDKETVYHWYTATESKNDECCVPVAMDNQLNEMVFTDGSRMEYTDDIKQTQLQHMPGSNDFEELCKCVELLRGVTERVLTPMHDERDDHEPTELVRQISVYNCLICADAAPNMFNYPCGHVCYCSACAAQVIDENKECPNCRKEIMECINIRPGGFYTDDDDED